MDRKGIPLLLLAFCLVFLGVPSDVQARITRIEISSLESPAFEGYVFPGIGTYDKIRGKAYGEVAPTDRRNAGITDIKLAPRNAAGKVEYSMDIYILRPTNPASGNGKLFFEVSNRGNKLFGAFNNSTGSNNPSLAADVQNDFLMHKGYTVAWSGWDPLAAAGGDRLTTTVPVLSGVTGPSYEYIVFDNPTTTSSALTYAAATLDKTKAVLTARRLLADSQVQISADGWEFVNERTIRLLPAGTAFQQSYIYEFRYQAKDPLVLGLGFAATRDLVSFLRYAAQDDVGNANPVAVPQYVYAFTISQPARYMNDFQTLGFTSDESGRKVFDGILNWLGGGSGVNLNFRFGQTGRTERNRQHHLFPEAVFPFAYPVMTDPYTWERGGRIAKCSADKTCPKVFEANSANEYWVKAASLAHTDFWGIKLPDPANVRFFLISGLEHSISGTPISSGPGICQQLRNPTDASRPLRALFSDLDEWVSKGIRPPNSEVPDLMRGTAVYVHAVPNRGIGIVPKEALGWPDIPGVTYTGETTARHLFNFGARFDEGILDINPPAFRGPIYPSLVSIVDFDGNEIAGIRVPPVSAPIATTSGWGLRSEAYGGPDGCEGSGQYIPFKTTKAERRAAGDPRLSLQERYKNHGGYVKAVEKAARQLVRDRFLLPEDAQKYIDEAEASTVLLP